MSPLKLLIEGEFWDSQIYEGRLYLFSREGSLLTVNWDELLQGTLGDDISQNIAVECGFRRGDYLYGSQWSIIFHDEDIRKIVTRRFAEFAKNKLHIAKRDLMKFTVREQKNPFPFPHSDSAIHYRTLIVGGQGGFWSSKVSKRNVNPIGTRPARLWDCPIYSVATGYQRVALAAGDEGLWHSPFEYYSFDETYDQVSQLSRRRSDKCNWMYGNVYGSSYLSGGFLAELPDGGRPPGSDANSLFMDTDTESDDEEQSAENTPAKPTEIEDSKIFRRRGFSWGIRNKICLHDGKAISVASYNPYSKYDEPISRPVSFDFKELHGAIVSAANAPFGSILEFDDRLVVILSDGSIQTLRGEPVNWRVFPSAKFYQNQLHAIYDDHLSIFSFNQDYFVDQRTKNFGINPIYDRIGGPLRRVPERTVQL
jgi:hypothetical protein